MTREQLANEVANRRWDRYAEDITGGCDYDEICQQATDELAEELGITQDYENEEYATLNELVDEAITAELA